MDLGKNFGKQFTANKLSDYVPALPIVELPIVERNGTYHDALPQETSESGGGISPEPVVVRPFDPIVPDSDAESTDRPFDPVSPTEMPIQEYEKPGRIKIPGWIFPLGILAIGAGVYLWYKK